MTRFASISLDLDNEWSYLKTHGNPAWSERPSYLELAVPRILDFLAERDLKITFFIVGRDADDPRHQKVMRMIADAGHDVGNHSYEHDPWLDRYTEEELAADIERAERSIETATGIKPTGFRAPGFSFSANTLKILVQRGYDYDATVFPNLLNPLARAYFFAMSNLSAEEKEHRKSLFGTFSDATRPIDPFRWQMDEKVLLEIPVTTMPVFRTPIHFSYLIYLGKFARPIANLYLRFALRLCRIFKTSPSFLLHPLDFMGADDVESLGFFPGMDLPVENKLAMLDGFLSRISRDFETVTMREHFLRANKRQDLKMRAPAAAKVTA